MHVMRMQRWFWAALALLTVAAAQAGAQTTPDAHRGGASLWVGAEFSNMQAGFPNGSSVRLNGTGFFITYNRTHNWGLDANMRFLNLNSWNGETQQNYLIGPRYTFLRSDKLRPFASFQVGAVRIHYPFEIGTGTSFAMAPGGGLDYSLGRKWAVRGSYQFQILPNSPNFTNEPKFGIRPNGFQAGISYRLF
jgi:opacity protein-like surface antigen